MKSKTIRYSILLGLSMFCPLWAKAKVTLPAIFADHMVLQRDQSVPVWGTADPGEAVTVEFAGQKKSVKADAEGQWRIDLDAMPASSKPREMTVSSQDPKVQIRDVLVGEVWLCGGQSNMWRNMDAFCRTRNLEQKPVADYILKETATANDPLFRQFKVDQTVDALVERADTGGAWTQAIPGETKDFTATGYFFGRELRQELDVPVALISCNWGGTQVQAWMPKSIFENDAALQKGYATKMAKLKKDEASWDGAKLMAEYEATLEEIKKAKENKTKAPRKPRKPEAPKDSVRIPATLYNGMVHSLVPYGIKGAIWYQGEANAGHSSKGYGKLFSAMIEAWRANWAQDTFYFYWCQLANFKEPKPQPVGDEGAWAMLRDQQRLALSLPDTGMAVLSDIGEAKDIHPHNKVDVGKRLSLWAMHQAYGKDLVCSGPLYKQATVSGNKIVITFDHAGSGLMVGAKKGIDPVIEVKEPLAYFQICGSDRQWQWATAKIVGKDTVEVWHPEIPKPVEVRYAWSTNPTGANLYNKEGLPASLFKTQ